MLSFLSRGGSPANETFTGERKSMLTKTARLLVVICLCLAIVPVYAADKCKDVVGHLDGGPASPGEHGCPFDAVGCLYGRMNGGIQADYVLGLTSAVSSGVLAGNPSVAFFVAKSIVTTKDGAVQGTYSGTFDIPESGGSGALTSILTFTSGGSGQLRITGVFSGSSRQISGDFTGTFCQ